MVTKAYGTLDQQEAQRIANNVNSQRGGGGDVFSRTRYGHGLGHIGKGLEGVPLVTYGRGVEALLNKEGRKK